MQDKARAAARWHAKRAMGRLDYAWRAGRDAEALQELHVCDLFEAAQRAEKAGAK